MKLLLLLMSLLVGCAHMETDMPKKKTILKSTQKSEENWQPSMSVGRLAERASIDGFTAKIPTGDHASVKIGAMKSNTGKTIGESRTDQSGRFMFGARFTKRF